MKKILLLLVGMFAYIQLVDAQAVCRRKELADNEVLVTTEPDTVRQKSKPVPANEIFVPVTRLEGGSFIDEYCEKYRNRGVQGRLTIGLASDLKGNITSITVIFPKELQMTDNEVSELLEVTKKHCRLDFKVMGVYKYADYVAYTHEFYLSE